MCLFELVSFSIGKLSWPFPKTLRKLYYFSWLWPPAFQFTFKIKFSWENVLVLPNSCHCPLNKPFPLLWHSLFILLKWHTFFHPFYPSNSQKQSPILPSVSRREIVAEWDETLGWWVVILQFIHCQLWVFVNYKIVLVMWECDRRKEGRVGGRKERMLAFI